MHLAGDRSEIGVELGDAVGAEAEAEALVGQKVVKWLQQGRQARVRSAQLKVRVRVGVTTR